MVWRYEVNCDIQTESDCRRRKGEWNTRLKSDRASLFCKPSRVDFLT